MDKAQIEKWLHTLKLPQRSWWVEQNRDLDVPFFVLVLRQILEVASQQAAQYEGGYLLLQDVYDALAKDKELTILLGVDARSVWEQETEIEYRGDTVTAKLDEELLAALSLLAFRYQDPMTFSFRSGELVSEKELATELHRHHYQPSYRYRSVFDDGALYFFDRDAFAQGVNTYFSWSKSYTPYHVYRRESYGREIAIDIFP
jgi:hypothetical protein